MKKTQSSQKKIFQIFNQRHIISQRKNPNPNPSENNRIKNTLIIIKIIQFIVKVKMKKNNKKIKKRKNLLQKKKKKQKNFKITI